mmetsp:Transcript_9972/g.30423  ORF Transcript_9972/g.30423 Transcript_9972/m.30423 type:complete len:130 (-) Transcript_9972:1781-2170(-)
MEPELELRRRLDAALLRLELFSQLYTARTLAGELGCTEEEAREAMIGVVRERADAVRSFWRIGLRKATRGVVVLVENEDGEERLFCEKVRKMVYDEGWLKMYAKIFAVCSQRVRANLGDICWNFADGGP